MWTSWSDVNAYVAKKISRSRTVPSMMRPRCAAGHPGACPPLLVRLRRSGESLLGLRDHPPDDLGNGQNLADAARALTRSGHDLMHASGLDRGCQFAEEA